MAPRPGIELSADILPRLRARDESAYRELIERVGPGLVHFAAQKLRSYDAAQDIVQDVLYRVWQQGGQFAPRGTVVAYLFTAVRNRTLDELKHERVVRLSHATLAGDVAHDEDRRVIAAGDADIGVEEEVARLRRLLTEHQRAAFALRYDQGLTIPEIAEVLDVRPKAVERLMARIREVLREHVFRHGGDAEG